MNERRQTECLKIILALLVRIDLGGSVHDTDNGYVFDFGRISELEKKTTE